MTVHQATCQDCHESYTDDDLLKVSEWAEDHQRTEVHNVRIERAVATDGGRDIYAGDTEHTRRAYHRDLDHSVRSALRVARIDQRSLYPATMDRSEWVDHPTDYFATVCWLLGDATYERFREVERQVAEEGETVERKLTDFAGGASA